MMDSFDVESFAAELEETLTHDDDSEAREILASGRPIHITRDDTPTGHVIRIYPDGREEVISVSLDALAALIGR